jgi:hypothetical protein
MRCWIPETFLLASSPFCRALDMFFTRRAFTTANSSWRGAPVWFGPRQPEAASWSDCLKQANFARCMGVGRKTQQRENAFP